MSIYFQYPAIDDYPAVAYAVKSEKDDHENITREDRLIKEQILELRDYLALKQL